MVANLGHNYLDGQADDHGRVYQQAKGQQFNIEQNFFGAPSDQLDWVIEPDRWPLVADLSPFQMGVHRAGESVEESAPEYVPRDIDGRVAASIRHSLVSGGLTLLLGDSTVGKTRTAYEALKDVVPDRKMMIPESGSEIARASLTLITQRSSSLLWLDNVERFIRMQDGALAALIHLIRGGVAVVATLRTQEYERLTSPDIFSVDTHHENSLQHPQVEQLFDMATTIAVDRAWTEGERARAGESRDRVIMSARAGAVGFAIAEQIAAGPACMRAYQAAWGVRANPTAAACLAAAIDLARLGMQEVLTRELIEACVGPYLADRGGDDLQPESLQEAFAWLTTPRFGLVRLLTQHADGVLRVFDYLVDSTERQKIAIPGHLWTSILGIFSGVEDRIRLAQAAIYYKSYAAAQAILGPIVNDHPRAMLYQGVVCQQQEEWQQAESWFTKAASNGSSEAMTSLGLIKHRAGQPDDAQFWFAKASDAGNTHATTHLGILAQERGDVAGAEAYFRQAAAAEEEAAVALSRLLYDDGRFEQAKAELQAAIDTGSIDALVTLGYLYKLDQNRDMADKMWRAAAGRGSAMAKANLAIMHSEELSREVQQWFEEALAGGLDVEQEFGIFLSDCDRFVEAARYLRRAAERGDRAGAYNYAVLLARQDKHAEALKWGRVAKVKNPTVQVLTLMAKLYDALGNPGEAHSEWRAAADHGDPQAMYEVAMLEKEAGDLDSAAEMLEKSADLGFAPAACELANMSSPSDQRIRWFGRAGELGHSHAYCAQGAALSRERRLDEAEAAWRAAYSGGHHHAAECLSRLYRSYGEGKKAAKWYQRRNGPVDPKMDSRRKKGHRPKKRR